MSHEPISEESFSFTVDGRLLPLVSTFSVADLIERLGYTGMRIAIERNGALLPKSQHSATRLKSGDRFEIVVGGG